MLIQILFFVLIDYTHIYVLIYIYMIIYKNTDLKGIESKEYYKFLSIYL